jgi:hypothetical protein
LLIFSSDVLPGFGKIQYPLGSLPLRSLDFKAVRNQKSVHRRQRSPLITINEVLAFGDDVSKDSRLQARSPD